MASVNLNLSLSEASYNTIENTSDVSINLSITSNNAQNLNDWQCPWEIRYNNSSGEIIASGNKGFGNNTTTQLYSGTLRKVSHNNDGTGSITLWAHYYTDAEDWAVSPKEASAASTLTLTKIARATPAPTVNCTIGTPTNIIISPQSGNTFYHRIHLTIGGIGYWLKSDGSITTSSTGYSTFGKSTTSIRFNVPTSLYNNFIGKYDTGIIKVYTYTYSSGTYTQVGNTQQNTLTVNCNSTLCTPLISGTAIDINDKTVALTGNENDVITNVSMVQIRPTIENISDTDDINTTIISTSVDGVVFNGTTHTIQNATKNSFVLRATNSRGYTGEYIINMTGELVEYTPLTFNLKELKRTEPTTGEVDITYDGKFYNGTFGDGVANVLSIGYAYREIGSDTWLGSSPLSIGTDYSVRNTFFNR